MFIIVKVKNKEDIIKIYSYLNKIGFKINNENVNTNNRIKYFAICIKDFVYSDGKLDKEGDVYTFPTMFKNNKSDIVLKLDEDFIENFKIKYEAVKLNLI